MLFTTPTEWAALGFTLIAGWLFGLASSSGGKKWKRQLEEAELNYASARDRDEAELWNAQIRIRDLERELRDSRPAPSATAGRRHRRSGCRRADADRTRAGSRPGKGRRRTGSGSGSATRSQLDPRRSAPAPAADGHGRSTARRSHPSACPRAGGGRPGLARGHLSSGREPSAGSCGRSGFSCGGNA